MKLEQGIKCSKNFILDTKIMDLNEFYNILLTHKSIFWNFRVFPTAFFLGWTIRTVAKCLEIGTFWTIKRI